MKQKTAITFEMEENRDVFVPRESLVEKVGYSQRSKVAEQKMKYVNSTSVTFSRLVLTGVAVLTVIAVIGTAPMTITYTNGSRPAGLRDAIANTTSMATPTATPNSAKIAFESYRSGNGEIYVMYPDG